MSAVVIGTWPFARAAVSAAGEALLRGLTICPSLVEGVKVVEEDPATGPYFVGVGGLPNHDGNIEVDAAVMRGADCHLGAVASVRGIASPASLALSVLQEGDTRGHFHSLLVGQGAQDFAVAKGFPIVSLETDESREAYRAFCESRKQKDALAHDTLSLVGVDTNGQVGSCVSTSGMSFKHPGRVGDSPLPGGGYYADSFAGAAAASGEGDKIMRFAPSFQVVQEMGRGLSPQEACEAVLARIQERVLLGGEKMFEMVLVAVGKDGRIGAGSTIDAWTDHVTGETYPGFPYIVGRVGQDGAWSTEVRIQGKNSAATATGNSSGDAVFPRTHD